MDRRQSVILLALLLGSHLFFASEFRAFPNPNAHSRVYLALAIVDHHRLNIDDVIARFGPVQDAARGRSGLYSDKPPGCALVLAPLAWGLRRAGVPRDDLRTMALALRVLGVTLPCLAFWFLTRRDWAAAAGGGWRGLAVILAGALGTNYFIYATQLFSHAAAGALLYLASRRAAAATGRIAPLALTGALLALAFTIDYTAAPAVAVVAVAVLIATRGRRGAAALGLLAGALPLATLWAAYNVACFGGPFALGYHQTTDPTYAAEVARGLFGLNAPHAAALAGMTLLPPHGLAFMSPFLVLAPIGWRRMARDPATRGAAWVGLAVFGASALFVSTLVDWRGGWSVSTRYLVPTLPLLLRGVAAAIAPAGAWLSRTVFVAGAAVGLLHVDLAARTFPDYSPVFRTPFMELSVPLLRAGCTNGLLPGGDGGAGAALLFDGCLLAALGVIVVAVCGDAAPPGRRAGRATCGRAALLAAGLLSAEWLVARPDGYHQRLGLADVMAKMGFTCASDTARAALHERTLAIDPDNLFELTQLGWVRAASPCDSLRDPAAAVRLAERRRAVTGDQDVETLDLLAAAYAASGRPAEARPLAERAAALAAARGDQSRHAAITGRLREYAAGRAWRAAPASR